MLLQPLKPERSPAVKTLKVIQEWFWRNENQLGANIEPRALHLWLPDSPPF